MAKDTYEYEGGGFGDGLDYNDSSDPLPKTRAGKTRKAIGEVAGGTYDSFFRDFKDTNKWKQAVVNELPKQHKFVYDTYESVMQTGDELYDQFTKETRPVLGEISKKLDDMVGEGSMFKGLTNKLKDKFYDPPVRQQGEASIMEDALGRVMTETFGGIDMLQQQREEKETKRRTAQNVTEQKLGQYQHEELLKAIQPMAVSISRLETYKLQIEAKFQRKQLELSFRSMMTQGRAYEHQKKSHLEMMDLVRAMVTNTALPEYAKIEKGERFKEMIRDRTYGGIQNALFGNDSAMGIMLNKFKQDVKSGIGAFTSALQQASMGLEMADGVFGKDSEMTIFETMGNIAGGELGGKARKAFITPIMDKLKEDPEFQKKGYDAAQVAKDPRLLINLLKNSDVYKNAVNGANGMKIEDIIGRLESYLKPQEKLAKFGSGVEGLMKPAVYTNKASHAQTDVIPGYLARILQQVTSANTKKAEPLLVYDYSSNAFVPRSGMANKASAIMKEYNAKSGFTQSAKVNADALLEELGLQPEDRNALAASLTLMARSSTAMDGGDINKFHGYSTATEREKKILNTINSHAGFNKGLKSSETMFKVRTASDDIRQRGDNLGAMLQTLIDQGHADILIESGIIELDPDKPGAYRTRGGSLSKMQREALYDNGVTGTMGTSDVNAKSSFKKYDKNRALNAIRKTPVTSWRYKGGKKRHVGPMAQDVNKNLGEEAAPNGEQLDLISMNGAAMAAIQKIAEDQERLANSNQGSMYLKAIARAVGAGETNVLADSQFTAVDYLKILADQVSKTNYLLENNRISVNIPGIDFSKFNMKMPKVDTETLKANGKKFVDPLIKTGNEYLDTLQSLLFSSIRDGFDLGKKGVEIGKKGLGTGKKWFFDKPANWFMEVIMRNEKEIKDKREWLYKKSVEAAGNAIDFGMSVITEKIPNMLKSQLAFIKGLKEGAKRILNPPRDIYVKGNIEPVMLAESMRRQAYVDENNKAIRGIDDLLTAQGSIRNIHTGSVVLTQSQLAEGVFDQEGNQLRTTAALGLGLIGAAGQAISRAAVGVAKWASEGTSIVDKGKSAYGAVKSGIGDFFGGMSGFGLGSLGTDARLLRLTAQIRDLIAYGKPKKLVSLVYNRDLQKHPLEGQDFVSFVYGKGFAEKLYGEKKKEASEAATNGRSSETGLTVTDDKGTFSESKARMENAGFIDNIKKAFKGYDKGRSFGQNMAAAFGSLGDRDPTEISAAFGEAKAGINEQLNKSKTYRKFKDLFSKAKQRLVPGQTEETESAVTDLNDQNPNQEDPKESLFARGKKAVKDLLNRKKPNGTNTEPVQAGDTNRPIQGNNDIEDAVIVSDDSEATPKKETLFQRTRNKVKEAINKKRGKTQGASASSSSPEYTDVVDITDRSQDNAPRPSLLRLPQSSSRGLTVSNKSLRTRSPEIEDVLPRNDQLQLGYGSREVGPYRGGETLPSVLLEVEPDRGGETLPAVLPEVEPDDGIQDVESRPSRPKTRLGRMLQRVKNNKYVKKTTDNLGKLGKFGKRFGVGGMLGKVAKGVGSFFMGGESPDATTDPMGGDLHKEGIKHNYATLLDNKSGKATFYDTNNDGVRDNGSTNQLKIADEYRSQLRVQENDKIKESRERAKLLMDDRTKKDDDFLSKLMGAVGNIFSFVTGGFGKVFKMIGGLGGIAKTVTGALGLGKKAIGGVFTAGKALLGRGMLGSAAGAGVRGLASRGLAAVGIGALASGSMAGTALGAAAFAARLALGPVGWGIMGAQVAWWAGKKIYKYIKRNDVDDFSRIRMYQYGLTDAEKDNYNKFLSLEEYLKEHVAWSGDSPSINIRSVKQEEILDIFDCDKEDAAKAEKIAGWFEDRFKPFFLNALASVKFADPKASFLDVSKFDAKQLEALCSKLEFNSGPYEADGSPIMEIPSLPNTFTDVKKLLVVLKNSVPYKKGKGMIENNAIEKRIHDTKKADTIAQEQALVEKQRVADLEKGKADKEKFDAENERKKLLQKRDGRQSDEDRAMMAIRAASEGRSLASMYREGTNELINANATLNPTGQQRVGNYGDNGAANAKSSEGDPDVSDDGGKEPPKPSANTDAKSGQMPTTGLASATGGLADPSKGLAGINKGKGVKFDGLNPEVNKAFMSMVADYYAATGKKINVSDGFRTYAEQAHLYATLPKGRAAPPGRSMHEYGGALDISGEDAAELERLGLLRKYGFTRPVGGEDWHLEPAGIQGQLTKAKQDPGFLAEMMKNSYGRGGGGIGTQQSARKYSRNDSYAMKLFNEGTSNKVELPDGAEKGVSKVDPIIGTDKKSKAVLAVGELGANVKTGGSFPIYTTPSQGREIIETSPTRTDQPSSDDGGKKPATPKDSATALYASKGISGFKAANDESPYGDIEKTKSLIAKYASESGQNPGFMQVVAGLESSMGTNMSPHMGSAQGPFQFMPATWNEQVDRYGKKYGIDDNASPTDLRAATLMAGEYFKANEGPIKKIRGDDFNLVDSYLTHMLGPGNSKTFSKLEDDEIAATAMPKAAGYNRNVFYDKTGRALTAGEVRKMQLDKINRVASEYGINISGLASKFKSPAKEAANDPSMDTDSSPKTTPKQNSAKAVTSGKPDTRQSLESKADEQIEASVTLKDESRRIEASKRYTGKGPEVFTKPPPAVQANEQGVSGLRDVISASNKSSSDLFDLTREQVIPLLKQIDASIVKLYELKENGVVSKASPPADKDGVITPSSQVSRTRRYGT